MSASPAALWSRSDDGFAQRHTLVGTDFSVLADGGRVVSGYGQHGRARMSGSGRNFSLYQGDRYICGHARLRDAKAHAERRASV